MPYSKSIKVKCGFTIAIFAAMFSFAEVHAAAPSSCPINTANAPSAAKHEGKRFTVVTEGIGRDIVLIPGLSNPREVWAMTNTGLRNCFTVHTIQIRGFGDDAGINADGPVLEPFAKELADYIDDEIIGKGRAKPVIIGHSLGGLSALMIGARYPELPGKIMVVDAVPFVATIFNPVATVDMVRAQAQALSGGMRASYRAEKPPFDGKDPGAYSQSGFYSNSPNGRTLVAAWSYAADSRVTAQAFYDAMTTDMRSELPNIIAPVTLLYAQDDSAMTAQAAQAAFEPQYKGTAKFEAKMITGSRHFIMLDQPEKFAAALDMFLAH